MVLSTSSYELHTTIVWQKTISNNFVLGGAAAPQNLPMSWPGGLRDKFIYMGLAPDTTPNLGPNPVPYLIRDLVFYLVPDLLPDIVPDMIPDDQI